MTKETALKIGAGLTTFTGVALGAVALGPVGAIGAGFVGLATWFMGLYHATPEKKDPPPPK